MRLSAWRSEFALEAREVVKKIVNIQRVKRIRWRTRWVMVPREAVLRRWIVRVGNWEGGSMFVTMWWTSRDCRRIRRACRRDGNVLGLFRAKNKARIVSGVGRKGGKESVSGVRRMRRTAEGVKYVEKVGRVGRKGRLPLNSENIADVSAGSMGVNTVTGDCGGFT